MSRLGAEWEAKLSMLKAIARSQEALARLLESAADMSAAGAAGLAEAVRAAGGGAGAGSTAAGSGAAGMVEGGMAAGMVEGGMAAGDDAGAGPASAAGPGHARPESAGRKPQPSEQGAAAAAAVLREHVRVLTGLQAAMARSVAGVSWRPPRLGAPAEPWLMRGAGLRLTVVRERDEAGGRGG